MEADALPIVALRHVQIKQLAEVRVIMAEDFLEVLNEVLFL